MNSDLRPQLHGVWSSVSGAWAEHADFIEERGSGVTERLLAATTPTQGDRVLELACGPGAVALGRRAPGRSRRGDRV